MNLVVNGQAQNGMWRIDDLDDSRVGLDFLTHPFALVDTKEHADLVVRCMVSLKPVQVEDLYPTSEEH